MKIHAKLILLFVAVAVLITAINGLVFIIQGENSLARRTEAQLESVAVLKENQLEAFIEDTARRLQGVAGEKPFVDNFLKSIEGKVGERLAEIHYKNCRELLKERLASEEGFNELFILDTEGRVYLSTDKTNEGQNKSAMPYFAEGRKGAFAQSFYYSLRLKQLTTVISSPIEDYAGKTVGVLAARINLDKISGIMLERSGLGETGETYLVNKFNYMVTESRFEAGLALKQTIYSSAVKDCLKGNSGRRVYSSYRDTPVIGVYRWLPETEACLVAEIGQEEALKPVKELRNVMAVVNIGVLILTIIVGLFLSRTITDPISRLVKGTEEVRGGNLRYKINIESKDEIGWLGRSFNEMAESLDKTTVSKAYVDSIIESMSDSLVVFTPELKISRVNRAVCELLGYKEEELINQPVEKIFSVGNLDFPKETIEQRIKDGSLINLEICYRTKSGNDIPVLCSVSLMKNKEGSTNCIICTAWDITEIKEAEKKLREAMEIKSKFTSMVSHELRTPLAAIKTGITLVLDGMAGEISNDQEEFLSIVKRNVDRLGRLINDVLDFQKLESGRMEFKIESNDISAVVKETHETMHSLAKEKGLKLILKTKDDLPKVKFDRDRILQVLGNLVNNAIKFTEKGKIIISARKDKDFIQVEVGDTGPGIKAEDLHRVFRSFEQLGRTKGRKIRGTGLGLAICKEIIEKHGGQIWVESEFGQGSTFYFTLPLKGQA